MANRFEKYRQTAQPAQPAAHGNRFNKYLQKPVEQQAMGPQTVNTAEKQSLPMSLGQSAVDLAKSTGTGVVEGTVGLATFPQTIGQMGADLVTRGINAVRGIPREQTDAQLAAAHQLAAMGPITPPTQQALQEAVNRVVPTYEPKSESGDYARTVGSFIPSAAQGPGGILRKGISAASAGIASEALGKATEGTGYEPLARAFGAAAGGLITVPRAAANVKTLAKEAPSQQAVKSAADAMYAKLRDAGIQYDRLAFHRFAEYLGGKLGADGFRAAQAPRTADIVQMIGERVGKGVDFNDLESIRKATGQILREGPAVSQTDKAAASIVMDALDSFAERAKVSTNGSLHPAQIQPMVREARDLARRNIIARDIEDMIAKAETYQSGVSSGLRNQFSTYLRSKRGKSLSQQERAAFFEVAKGTPTQNALATIGRLGVDLSKMGNIATLLPAAAAGGTYAATGDPMLAATVAAVGTGAKLASRRMVANSAERAKGVVLAGRGEQAAVRQDIARQKGQAALQALLGGQQAVANQTQLPAAHPPHQSMLAQLLGALR